jgi:DNA polymerase-3 subunit gamma/tau
MTDRVLALSMRPKTLPELVGQDTLIETLNTQFATNRIPHFFIISGAPGIGKTTLARILALILQSPAQFNVCIKNIDDLPWKDFNKLDIHEINAANKNGIDDVRQLSEMMKYQPMKPSVAKVVILDEAHQLTTPAQNALLTETEDVSKHVYYIFCTSALNKILPALQRRAYIISPKPLTSDCVIELLAKAKERVGFTEAIGPLEEALKLHDVRSPGLILQAAERFFSGLNAQDSVLSSVDNTNLDTMAICRSVIKGDWKTASNLMKDITKSDVIMLRSCILGYLKTAILKSVGPKAINIAKAMQIIASSPLDEIVALPGFLAALCLACEKLST